MSDQTPFISVKIDTRNPIALNDFVATFTALGNEYERYIKINHPDLVPTASVYVRQVRKGSIIAELVGWAMATAPIALNYIDQALIVEDFIKRHGKRLSQYFSGQRVEGASRGELNDFMDQVRGIANDPAGRAEIQAITYEDGKRQVKAAVTFDTDTARRGEENMLSHYNDLQRTTGTDQKHVLLQYVRPNIEGKTGVRRGERGKIESYHPKSLPIIYASDNARQKIQAEMAAADGNIFNLLFEIDVNVEVKSDGTPRAYRIVEFYQVHEDD
jgi:hypothetical protein